MAKRLNEKSENGTDRTHNLGEQKKIIAEAALGIIRLKAERAAIQEAIGEQRAKVKALGIRMTDFNAALRLYELEADERDQSLDGLRLCFEALGLGEQGSLFPSDEEVTKARRSRAGKALDAAAAHLGGAA